MTPQEEEDRKYKILADTIFERLNIMEGDAKSVITTITVMRLVPIAGLAVSLLGSMRVIEILRTLADAMEIAETMVKDDNSQRH